jgi:general secretion pathway protein I
MSKKKAPGSRLQAPGRNQTRNRSDVRDQALGPEAWSLKPGASRGFTLIEVMAALAILAIGLTLLLRTTARTVRNAEATRTLSAATLLARGKMYDVEEQLRKDGFQQMSDVALPENEGTFEEEGWPQIHWKVEIREIELPSPEALQAMAQQQAEAATAAAAGAGTGTGTGSGAVAGDGSSSGLFGMLSMFGGGGGMSAEDAAGGSFRSGGGYNIVQEVFKASIRKVVLSVTWKVMGDEDYLDVVEYLTDPDAMNRVIGGASGATGDDYAGETPAETQPPAKTPPSSTPPKRGGK